MGRNSWVMGNFSKGQNLIVDVTKYVEVRGLKVDSLRLPKTLKKYINKDSLYF